MNGRRPPDGAGGLGGNVSTISHELLRLAELQLRLFALESRQAARRLMLIIVLTALAVASLVGGSIAGLAGFALFLDVHTSLSTWGAFAVTGAVGVVLTAGLALAAALILRASADKLYRHSAKELSTNVDCIKNVLSRPEQN